METNPYQSPQTDPSPDNEEGPDTPDDGNAIAVRVIYWTVRIAIFCLLFSMLFPAVLS